MEFRRIDALPPYAFAHINALKMQLRRAGEDVIDLGFGNPDLPSPDVAVEKLIEAVRNPRNHRYSLSNGIPKLREALAALYARKFDVVLDFETEVCSTIGAKDVAVELYTLTKSFSMAGWRMGFLVGNAEVVAALARLKSYLDYGTFQPVQIAATVAMNEAPEFPKAQNAIYRGRRDTLIDGLDRIGWSIERPKGTMFVWAPIPEPYSELTSQEFAQLLVTEAKVAVSPGSGFGPGGEGFVRVALG